MAMSKDEFKNAFREAVSKQYSHIPAEDEIDFEFSEKFKKKMDKHIFTTKKSIWKFMNSTAKKVAIIVLIIILSSTSVYAVTTTIIKIKNKYQLAAEQGIPLEEVDTEGDFKYTKFDEAEKETVKDENTDGIVTERFEDPKTDIYNKMLNSIDFFNELEIIAETSMVDDTVTTIKYQTNIDESYAYEAVIENGITIIETYCNPKDYQLMRVDNRNKTYGLDFQVYRRADTPYIPLADRIGTNESDNLPCFNYRRNVTNCPYAEYCIAPQGLTYSYLGNFDLWDIVDTTTYLERECVVIKGSTKPWVLEKHNSNTFTMLVDKETGILMKFEGYKDGEVDNYITVTDCSIGKTKTDIKEFDLNNYDGYSERNRHYIPNEDRKN